MTTVQSVCDWLEALAPRQLAEDWDNVGLLVGDSCRSVERVMTCLTLTEDCLDEAIGERADLVITHHPLPFRPLSRITSADRTGRLILQAIQANVAILSPHTAFDSAAEGINFQLAQAMGLSQIEPCRPAERADADWANAVGAGRMGILEPARTGQEVMTELKSLLGIPQVAYAGPLNVDISRVAIACGSAGEFLADAIKLGCDAFVTGESNFHTCLEARGQEILLILTGHFASERFALEWMAEKLSESPLGIECWASRVETDPVRYG